jgi:uncharacterized protein YacL
MKDQKTKWDDWTRKDQIIFIIIIFFLVLALGNGMANMVANLRISDPTYIEYPWLAILVALIVPIISMAIKFVTNFFEYDHNRKRYSTFIFLLTGISAASFLLLFGQIYTGVAMDFESIGESHNLGSVYVLAQTLTEILAASALALAAEDIYMKYYPDSYIENPEFIQNERARKDHSAEHEKLEEKRRQVHGRITELEASRQAYINEKIIEYISLRAKHISTMNAHRNT